jgi:RNA polymerase sigma-54 factor
MALEMKQSQRMSQELRMTPQLQQAIKLLQLSRLELVDVIATEMVENPMLEEVPDDGGWNPEPEGGNVEMVRKEPTAEDAAGQKAVQEIDWESYIENYSSPMPASSAGYDDELPGVDQTLANSTGLIEYLLEQLGTMDTQPGERALAEQIIYDLDEEGYLRDTTVEEIAEREGVTVDEVDDALVLVQELEPAGIGARNLSECLLLQAQREYPYEDVLHDVIRNHLHDLEKRNYGGVARILGVRREDIMDAHRTIQTFNPRPGRQFADDSSQYIIPDIYIVKQNGEWIAQLNDDGMPRLRVSDHYRRALRGGAPGANRDAKEYVQERLRSAIWLIRSIEQRQRTIMKVTQSIIRYQHDFLEFGIDHLRPLVLRDIAEDIGMHESTISRVTTNKYVHTPRGIFELKFFFNSSIRKRGGDDVAAEAVKHRIRQLISEEDTQHPLSDQQLADILHKDFGIEIARRTVAKYREMQNILSSSKRRQVL